MTNTDEKKPKDDKIQRPPGVRGPDDPPGIGPLELPVRKPVRKPDEAPPVETWPSGPPWMQP